MFKTIQLKNYISALKAQRTVYFSTLGILKIYHCLSELLITDLKNEICQLCLSNPSLDQTLVTCSPSYCFAIASCSEIAKNLLDPKLDVTRVLVQIMIHNDNLKISFIDNGCGFPIDTVPWTQEIAATKALNISGPFSRGTSSKVKGDGSGGGCGRGFAQIVDWFNAIELDPSTSLTFSRLNRNGGCILTFCSPLATDLSEKHRCEQAIASVLSDFSVLSDRATDEMKQQKMQEIQAALRKETTEDTTEDTSEDIVKLDLKIPHKINRIAK